LISSNANGGIGYLPPRDAHEGPYYTNPDGLAPKVFGLYALALQAEPLVRQAAARSADSTFVVAASAAF